MDRRAHALVELLRTADWLTADRVRAYLRILMIVTLVIVAGVIVLSHDGLDPRGEPLGTDFVSFWAASKLALAGEPLAAWTVATHRAVEIAIFGRDTGGYTAFFYPPVYLLICLPLALLPYFPSLIVWLLTTGVLYGKAVRAWLGQRCGWLAIGAFPAVLGNIGHGQNGFLSGALMGAGAMWLERRPVAAGLCLGAMVWKPQLGLVIPFALIAARRWLTLAVAVITALALIGLSAAVFGAESWRAFFAGLTLARETLEQGLVEPAKMQSAFAAARVLGGSVTLAYAAQAASALFVVAGLFVLQHRAFRSPVEAPALIAASLMASPFMLDYDLTLLAFPLAFIAREGVESGFRPWEKIAVLAGFLLPGIARSLATAVHVPLTPLVVAALFVLILRRGLVDQGGARAASSLATRRHSVAGA